MDFSQHVFAIAWLFASALAAIGGWYLIRYMIYLPDSLQGCVILTVAGVVVGGALFAVGYCFVLPPSHFEKYILLPMMNFGIGLVAGVGWSAVDEIVFYIWYRRIVSSARKRIEREMS